MKSLSNVLHQTFSIQIVQSDEEFYLVQFSSTVNFIVQYKTTLLSPRFYLVLFVLYKS